MEDAVVENRRGQQCEATRRLAPPVDEHHGAEADAEVAPPELPLTNTDLRVPRVEDAASGHGRPPPAAGGAVG